MLKQLMFISLSCIAFNIQANEKKGSINKPDGLSIGIGAVGQSGLYLGEKTEVTPIPVIAYEGEHFFVRGLYAGMQFYRDENITVNGIVSANMMHLDVDKLSDSKLKEKNIDKSQLEDRDRSVDLGMETLMKLPYGVLSMQALQDIGAASKGTEIKVNYQYFWRLHPQFTLIPNVGFDWLSNKRANYYYGILDEEVARGITAYQPNQLIIPHLSLGARYRINPRFDITGVAVYKFLPNKIEDGPLVDQKSLTNFFMAVTYKF
ncbi:MULTISPECIES: MipA/OmpV family protein [unclassified Acinetobacter]|uniref:MipA/OmpV family protein n=1 Tax=unclassified Acinetobacter TaxID=196816 RepID=UPI002934FB3D|nr:MULTISPECIES: MipA/OmpV family protein [unclassified Acinetobacter]WOE32423.1 MipA/OmpV family protein [Acinetobacter sp. SAAs470]WOE37897.1 MipA/OmpV family protein [Acinetobacter sp. SAAs474]